MRSSEIEKGRDYLYSRYDRTMNTDPHMMGLGARRFRVIKAGVPGWRTRWSFGSTRRIKGEVDEDAPNDHTLGWWVDEHGEKKDSLNRINGETQPDRVLNRHIRMSWDEFTNLKERRIEEEEAKKKVRRKLDERRTRLASRMEQYGFELKDIRLVGPDSAVVSLDDLEEMMELIQDLQKELNRVMGLK